MSAKNQHYFEKHLFRQPQIQQRPRKDLSIIIVIPCFNEPDIVTVLNSLKECEPAKNPVEVIVVINAAADADIAIRQQNEISFQKIQQWLKKDHHLLFQVHVLREEELPPKHAGVGLARKIGMDEAAFRFEQIQKNDGVIVCLDADCTVEKNYLVAIEDFFAAHPAAKAASIYFEHPLEYEALLTDGIIFYELHLRYYIQALRFAGYPFAFHTVGSSMCVRNLYYQKAGGMNRRKAGEDFHFLHKLMPLENYADITTTTVFPSARISARVPFGTGKAMQEWVKTGSEFLTYEPQIFCELKTFLKAFPNFYRAELAEADLMKTMPLSVQDHFLKAGVLEKIQEVNKHTSSKAAFVRRFYQWLNGLNVLQFVHSATDKHFPAVPVTAAAEKLLKIMDVSSPGSNPRALLKIFRRLDKCA